ncbi:hypothetical protein DSO57_1027445 [Entomophthora muscae]|uniref:Uncharacterized protein n=1 Tax=Entomophthora muscae TaxID=34485 RepID=A0ACC2RGE6_9FUNG|nr:hypothetical protein DSO57_1027445 [Entomophthora muscae]
MSHYKVLFLKWRVLPFKEVLPGLPPKKIIHHTIQLKGVVPKVQPIYCLTPSKDNALCTYLKEAPEKGLIIP